MCIQGGWKGLDLGSEKEVAFFFWFGLVLNKVCECSMTDLTIYGKVMFKA